MAMCYGSPSWLRQKGRRMQVFCPLLWMAYLSHNISSCFCHLLLSCIIHSSLCVVYKRGRMTRRKKTGWQILQTWFKSWFLSLTSYMILGKFNYVFLICIMSIVTARIIMVTTMTKLTAIPASHLVLVISRHWIFNSPSSGITSFNKCILSTRYVPGTVTGTGESTINKKNIVCALIELMV